MKTLKPENYEEYSNDNLIEDIGGTLNKRFIRIDSNFIAKYFDEISKPNSSYQSYADDLIRECYDPKYRDAFGQRDLPLKYFSVLIKETDGHNVYNGETNEVVCSRLCNLFGVPTVYNDRVKYNGGSAIISLDFLKDNEEIVSVYDIYKMKYPRKNKYDFIHDFDDSQTMENWVELIKELLDYYISPDAPNRDQIIYEVCADFCVQMFFKLLVLNDEDFSIQNVSMLVSEDKKSARLSPAYDFEYCRYHSFSVIGFFVNAVQYFKFMQINYPEKLAKFMENFKKSSHFANGEINDTRIRKILKDNYKQDYLVDDFLHNIVENVNRIDFIYNKFIQGKLEDVDITSLQREYLEKTFDRSKY